MQELTASNSCHGLWPHCLHHKLASNCPALAPHLHRRCITDELRLANTRRAIRLSRSPGGSVAGKARGRKGERRS